MISWSSWLSCGASVFGREASARRCSGDRRALLGIGDLPPVEGGEGAQRVRVLWLHRPVLLERGDGQLHVTLGLGRAGKVELRLGVVRVLGDRLLRVVQRRERRWQARC